MKVQGNLIIFSTDNEERKDVRRLKEKKLQVVLDENNTFPTFEVKSKEYIKNSAENEIENIFKTKKFYIEQLYTWGDPSYYTDKYELTVSYLVIINKHNISEMPKNLKFYDIEIENKEGLTSQNVTLSNENKKIQYEIDTIVKQNRDNI